MSAKRERKLGLLLIVSVIAIIVLFSMMSCSSVQHGLPEYGQYYVTKDGQCTKQSVFIDYQQDIFASKISLTYADHDDTFVLPKLFRRDDANTYSYLADSVVIGKGQILKIISNKTVIVDYECHLKEL